MLIGIDIGGTKIHVVGSHLGDKIEFAHSIATPHNQRLAIPEIITAVHEIAGRSPVDAIGIASPGPIDKRRGTILTPSHIPWRNLRLVDPLKSKFGCPVSLENDATCGGVAESIWGAGKPFRTFVYITISTGIGTSIIVDKKPLPTAHNSEGGRMIIEPSLETLEGQIGTFETITSGQAIEQRFGKIAADIHDAASWQIIAHELALGFYNIITLVDPEALVLAGGVSVHHRRFLQLVENNLKNLPLFYPIPKLLPARFITDAPALGALHSAAELLGA